MSDTVDDLGPPLITKQRAALAVMNCFLANAEAGNHAANDELIAQLARHQRAAREYCDHPRVTPGP